jgi:hypothetical protein
MKKIAVNIWQREAADAFLMARLFRQANEA